VPHAGYVHHGGGRMKVTIKIKMDNAAFVESNNGELARLLEDIAKKVRDGNDIRRLRPAILDINGNVVGSITITGK